MSEEQRLALAERRAERDALASQQREVERLARRERDLEASLKANGAGNSFLEGLLASTPAWKANHKREQLRLKAEEKGMLERTLPAVMAPCCEHEVLAARERRPLPTPATLQETRVNIKWKTDHPELVQQAIAMNVTLGGGVETCARTLAQLKLHGVLNVSKLFNRLELRTLKSWVQKEDAKLLGDEGELKKRQLPRHMQSPISKETEKKLEKSLVELGEAGATLCSTSIIPLWTVLVKESEPGVLEEQGGSFKMSASWVNKLCCKLGFSMQRKTTTSNHLPDNWKELVDLMVLRAAFIIGMNNIPPELVVNIDETPVKTTPNAESKSRYKVNSGDNHGIGKDNKFQITATFAITAAGLLGAPSAAELKAQPELAGKPSLKTQLIFPGVEVQSRGRHRGMPLRSACPTELLASYSQFCVAQTPSHFAKFGSMKLLFKDVLVPYYEEMIVHLGLVGEAKLDDLRRTGEFDESNPAHRHQQVLCKLDVYAVHRELRTRDWVKEMYPWINFNFVPARCTPKAQELDVDCNSQIQHGARMKLNDMQVENLEEQRKLNKETIRIVLTREELKKNVFPLLQAGLEHGRAMGVKKLKAIWTKTGFDKAWDPDVQAKAKDLHCNGLLFSGDRKEDLPYGQEAEPEDLLTIEGVCYKDAPERPARPKKSARELYVKANRDAVKTTNSFKTMKQAEALCVETWKALPPSSKKPWEMEKRSIKAKFTTDTAAWRQENKAFLKAKNDEFLAESEAAPDDDEGAVVVDEDDGGIESSSSSIVDLAEDSAEDSQKTIDTSDEEDSEAGTSDEEDSVEAGLTGDAPTGISPAPKRAQSERDGGGNIPDELLGEISNEPGSISMANTGQPNSGGSQSRSNFAENLAERLGEVIEGPAATDEPAIYRSGVPEEEQQQTAANEADDAFLFDDLHDFSGGQQQQQQQHQQQQTAADEQQQQLTADLNDAPFGCFSPCSSSVWQQQQQQLQELRSPFVSGRGINRASYPLRGGPGLMCLPGPLAEFQARWHLIQVGVPGNGHCFFSSIGARENVGSGECRKILIFDLSGSSRALLSFMGTYQEQPLEVVNRDWQRLHAAALSHSSVDLNRDTLVWGGSDFEIKALAMRFGKTVVVFDCRCSFVNIYTEYDCWPGWYYQVPLDCLGPNSALATLFDPVTCIGLIYNGDDHYNYWLPDSNYWPQTRT